ncbi:MAG: SRPBCC family protein [Iphinoe sp. HA4291-MV1]|jgi:ribosome-associated toxin RatA of RatAB toxin-antitoxin module|nr:SRPBCC family protein [Iphinoe sp. HA4291-MV1]
MQNSELRTQNALADSAIPQAVEIKIEQPEKRQMRISASIQIPYSLEQVWQVLTDYEAFAEFMPNITHSRRLEHPTRGIRVEQISMRSFMGMKLSTRSVFDVEEKLFHEILYRQIEGDFKAFSNHWRLEPLNLSDEKAGVNLANSFLICPKQIIPIPMTLFEDVFRHDVSANMLAIRQRVEELFSPR